MKYPISASRAPSPVLTLSLLFAAAPASAWRMPSYDMASLYYMADVVAEVEELGYTKEDYSLTGKVRALKVYKGRLKAGDEITLSVYLRERHWPRNKPLDVKSALVFLRWDEKKRRYLVWSIKLVLADGVLRYTQFCSPGQPVLTFQHAELLKLPKGAPYTRAELEQDLALAIERVKEFERAFESRDPKRLQRFLRPLKDTWPVCDDRLSEVAASLLAEVASPETVFGLLAGTRYDWSTRRRLARGFGTRERLEHLWRRLEDRRLPPKSKSLVFELIAENKAARDWPEEYRARIVSRAIALLEASTCAVDTRGAGRVLRSWHTRGGTIIRGSGERIEPPPAALDHPVMTALRGAIDRETDPYLKFELVNWYCFKGDEGAYRDLFEDEIYIVASAQATDGTIPRFGAQAFHRTAWKVMRVAPVLTARATGGEDAGTLYVARSNDETRRRWEKALETWGSFSGSMPYGSDFPEPLPPGLYEFRIRGEYEKDGRTAYWWSFPVRARIGAKVEPDESGKR